MEEVPEGFSTQVGAETKFDWASKTCKIEVNVGYKVAFARTYPHSAQTTLAP